MGKVHAIYPALLSLASFSAYCATTITYTYDELNRLESTIRSDGPGLTCTYDEVGNITRQTSINPDSDGDLLRDIEEIAFGTNPNLPDSDMDGLTDFFEVNFDGNPGYDPYHPVTNPTGTDLDANAQDTDGDGVDDNIELLSGTSPLDPASFPVLADGDLNADGMVNAVDVLIAFQILNGEIIPDATMLQHGDVAPLVGGVPHPNGVFNPGDAYLILRKATGESDF